MRSGAPIDCGHTWTVHTPGSDPTDHRCGRGQRHDGDHMCLSMSSTCRATKPRTHPAKRDAYDDMPIVKETPAAMQVAVTPIWHGRPSLRFVPHSADWVSTLRGQPFFQFLADEYRAWGRIDGDHARVKISNGMEVPPPREEILFLIMPDPIDEFGMEIFARYAAVAAMIVDITADVFNLCPPTGASRSAAETNSKESNDHWARPDVQDRLFRMMQMATVVTTSWEHLVEPLHTLTGVPVVYLPDWHDEDEGKAYSEAFLTKVMPAVAANRYTTDKAAKPGFWERFWTKVLRADT